DRIVWPYPVMRDFQMYPGKTVTEKGLAAVALIVLRDVKGEGVPAPAAGYCIAVAADGPPEQIPVKAGESYQSAVFENFVPEMYVPLAPDKPWPKPITRLDELLE